MTIPSYKYAWISTAYITSEDLDTLMEEDGFFVGGLVVRNSPENNSFLDTVFISIVLSELDYSELEAEFSRYFVNIIRQCQMQNIDLIQISALGDFVEGLEGVE